jgi:hypothetical protein
MRARDAARDAELLRQIEAVELKLAVLEAERARAEGRLQ